jgi:hypothetical protein
MSGQLAEKDFDKFFSYLDKHLAENGKDGAPLFQPSSRSQSGFPREKREGFIHGLSIPVGEPKWKSAIL